MPCHQKAFLPLTDPGEEKHPAPLSPRNRKRCNLMRLERKMLAGVSRPDHWNKGG